MPHGEGYTLAEQLNANVGFYGCPYCNARLTRLICIGGWTCFDIRRHANLSQRLRF